jgi:hypothetical protein
MKSFGEWLEDLPLLGPILKMCQNLAALPRKHDELAGKIAGLEKRASDFESEMSQQVESLARSLRESRRTHPEQPPTTPSGTERAQRPL